MMIVLKKLKRNNNKELKTWRNNIKEGMKEIREGFGYLNMKGDQKRLTVYPKTREEMKRIRAIAHNYAIPYTVRL